MLQQTRVETVIPYCERFLARFPTSATLAQAPRSTTCSRSGPASATTRARATCSAPRSRSSRATAARCPTSAEALRELPGIGRYTAGAVASIAFDRPAPLVDGNVARVLARLRGIREDDREHAVAARGCGRSAEALVAGPRPAISTRR